MKKSVLYFLFQAIHDYPPCISQICMLRDKGIDVALLTSACSPETRELLEGRGVKVYTFTYKQHPIRLVQKAMNFVYYNQVFRRFFRENRAKNSVLWLGSEESAIKLWWRLKGFHPMVLNALEFYEYDWYQKGMRKIAPSADVCIACQPKRAEYMVDWWKLGKMPYLMPNKPYFHPQKRNMPGSTPDLQAAIGKIQGKKILLYQGVVNAERDLTPLAKALAQMESDYTFAICGNAHGEILTRLQEIYPKTIYLGHFPAPLHLEITSHAHIGIAYYLGDSINTRYCAPNKIYEYAGFGLPILCNVLPGLTETVGKAGAAECVDFSDPDKIAEAIRKIDANYAQYQSASHRFYEETDNTQTMEHIITDVFPE